MSAHLERGRLLLERGRDEHAERELRQALAEDPENPMALSLLGLALLGQEKRQEAEKAARSAVRVAPDMDFPLYVLSGVLMDLDRYPDALTAIDRALAMDPEDADYWTRRAQILICAKQWDDALLATESALECDAEHVDALNFRSLCLQQTGKTAEAAGTAEDALREDPDNALAHANRGWTYLREGRHREAEEHFREALRLEPDMEWAREGVVTSLKSRNIVYRGMLRYFFWMSRLSDGARWAVILGIVFGRRILNTIAETRPDLRGPAIFLGGLLFTFILLTWAADPVANCFLLFHPFGRLALSKRERLNAWCTALLLATALACLIGFVATDEMLLAFAAAGFAVYILPLGAAILAPPKSRLKLQLGAAGIGVVGLIALAAAFIGSENASMFGGLYVIAIVIFSWVAALSANRD